MTDEEIKAKLKTILEKIEWLDTKKIHYVVILGEHVMPENIIYGEAFIPFTKGFKEGDDIYLNHYSSDRPYSFFSTAEEDLDIILPCFNYVIVFDK